MKDNLSRKNIREIVEYLGFYMSDGEVINRGPHKDRSITDRISSIVCGIADGIADDIADDIDEDINERVKRRFQKHREDIKEATERVEKSGKTILIAYGSLLSELLDQNITIANQQKTIYELIEYLGVEHFQEEVKEPKSGFRKIKK